MSNTVTDVSKLDGTERTQEYVDRLTGILGQMQSAPQEQRNPILEDLFGLFIDWNKQKIRTYREGKPIAVTWYEGEENFVGDSEIIALGGASNETKDRPLG